MKHYDLENPKPELVIGIAGPAGTDLPAVAETIEELLSPFGYQTFQIRVSKLIAAVCSEEVNDHLDNAKFDKKVRHLMNAADCIRNEVKNGAALVPLIISRIRFLRQEYLLNEECKVDYEEVELYNRCYIINSLKHPDEVKLLQKVYGNKFIMISAFSNYQSREANLISQIQKSYKTTDDKDFKSSAAELMDLDRRKSGSKIGQNLSSTFHLADFFATCDNTLEPDLKRFFNLLFGYPYITPTRDEMYMYEAQSAAYRSADLSRQIGAVIVDRDDFVVSRGCNEVPIPSGGSYWQDDSEAKDNRDFKTGRDYNAVKKIDIIKELLEFLDCNVGFTQSKKDASDDLVNELLFGKYKNDFKDLRVSNLIEFGRVVHAEMHAIVEAARKGVSINKGTIYTTTFPCHMCGRHIIAAGIDRVVYIEPYPKSMTRELFDKEIRLDDEGGEYEPYEDAVSFEPFNGVAPKFFQQVFSAPKRKTDDGYILPWVKALAQPRCANLSTAHLPREAVLSAQFGKSYLIHKIEQINGE